MNDLSRIISGGQTGTDRAALDWAQKHGIETGGWVPRGGWSEDGANILEKYPSLQETSSPEPNHRTWNNVRDSDASLIFFPELSPGTALSLQYAEKLGKPYYVALIDHAAHARDWLQGCPLVHTLNVSGPRESERAGVYDLVWDFLEDMYLL